MSDERNPTTLKSGHFYWAIPARDVDTGLEWMNQAQPARYVGLDAEGRNLWFWLGVEGDGPNGESDWPAIWVGEELQNG